MAIKEIFINKFMFKFMNHLTGYTFTTQTIIENKNEIHNVSYLIFVPELPLLAPWFFSEDFVASEKYAPQKYLCLIHGTISGT